MVVLGPRSGWHGCGGRAFSLMWPRRGAGAETWTKWRHGRSEAKTCTKRSGNVHEAKRRRARSETKTCTKQNEDVHNVKRNVYEAKRPRSEMKERTRRETKRARGETKERARRETKRARSETTERTRSETKRARNGVETSRSIAARWW